MNDRINYIWVGKPRSVAGDKPQQDLIGPLKMYLAIDHLTTSIRFWCLEKYTKYYDSLLKDTPIIVTSIESFLHESFACTDMAESAEKVAILVNRADENDLQIRACVTAKESFAFFLMAAKGGYVLDTNVLPAADYIKFPEYAVFFMPAYGSSVVSRDNDDDADVGIMFSPPTNRTHATRALNFFLKRVSEVDDRFLLHERYSETYNAALIHVVIQAALTCDPDPNRCEMAFWPAKRFDSGFPIFLGVSELGVVKFYANSHGAPRGGPHSALHDAAAMGDSEEVKRLLEAGCLYNQTISTVHHEHVTPLRVAAFYAHQAIVDQLRQQEKKLSCNVTDNLYQNNSSVHFFTQKKPARSADKIGAIQCVVM